MLVIPKLHHSWMLSFFFLLILTLLFHLLNIKMLFHITLFVILKIFNFISRLRPSLDLVLTFLSSIFIFSSTFFNEGLCIFGENFLFYIFFVKLFFIDLIDNALFKIELLIVTIKVSQLSNNEHSDIKAWI